MSTQSRPFGQTLRLAARAALTLVIGAQLVLFAPLSAQAGSFGTSAYLDGAAGTEQELRVQRVQEFLSADRVRDQLAAFGVDPADAERRVASLTADELALLDGRIAELDAGAGVVGIVGAVFIVLLVLELVGVTNVFTGI